MKTFTRILFIISLSSVLISTVYSQPGMWTWMKGSNTTFAPGSYGTMGVPSPTNEPPGRYSASHWTDTSGNFWLYGADFSDLWKFDPITTEWTWMRGDTVTNGGPLNIASPIGVYNALNDPAATFQGKMTWTTKDNHLWLFGDQQNLWQYDPAINKWAWMGSTGPTVYGVRGTGTANTKPGDRTETSTSWVDTSGNLWLFGGYNGGDRNDMWKFDPLTYIWTWMSGTNLLGNAGNYGALGVPSVNNVPPARSANMTWRDNSGNFWLTGGEAIGGGTYYQDVWKFNPQTLEWTWVSGLAGSDPSGPIGVNCDTAAANKEGKRWENRAVFKVCDELVINHSGSPVGNYASSVNDLWAYLPSYREWLLISTSTQNGNFGVQGVANASNYPPARVGAMGWVDKQKNLWLFGGTTVLGNWYNDLWKYQLDCTCLSIVAGCLGSACSTLQANSSAVNPTCFGSCNGTASASASNGTPPYHYLWAPTGDTTSTINNLCAGTYYVTITDSLGGSATASVIVTQPAPVGVNIGNDTAVCLPDTITLDATLAGASYLWNDGSTTATINAFQTGAYVVTVTLGSCSQADSMQLTENPKPPASVTASQTFFCTGDSAQICANAGMTSYLWNTGATSQCIETQLAGNYYVTLTDANGCSAASNHLAIAVYTSPPVSISVNGDTLTSYNAVTYQWFLNGNPINGATNQTYIATQGGSYTVEITDTNGCAATSTAVIISSIAPLSLGEGSGVRIYPNPNAEGVWNLEVNNELLGSQLEIFDAEGRLVLMSNIEHRISNIELNVAGGIYLLRIVSEKKVFAQKLIKL